MLIRRTFIKSNVSKEEEELLEWLKSNNILDDLCRFCKHHNALNRLTSGILGWTWENDFIELCKNHGFNTEKAPLGQPYDCLVNNYRVQCKYTSSQNNRIDIRNKNKINNRRYSENDFDILALKRKDEIYIIDVYYLINNKDGMLYSSLDINKFLDCKDNFECLKT